jgi:Arc/MetJ family transcription regulator
LAGRNPVYYEFMLGCNWRERPVADITQHVIDRSHRRYGLASHSAAVAEAWTLLVQSSYSQDLSVQDGTGE